MFQRISLKIALYEVIQTDFYEPVNYEKGAFLLRSAPFPFSV